MAIQNTVATPYTGAGGVTQDMYDKLASSYTSQVRGAPQVKQQLGEEMMASEGSIEPLAEERSKMIEQLYSADKDLGARYQAPTSEMYIESPLAAQQAISGAEAPMWKGIEKYNTIIGARKAVLGDALNRGMELYNAGLKAKEIELTNMEKTLERLQAKALAESSMAYQREKDARDQANWEKQFGLESYKAATAGSKTAGMSKEAVDMLQQTMSAQQAIEEVEKAYKEMEAEAPQIVRSTYGEKLANVPALSMYPKLKAYQALVTKYALPLAQLTGIDVTGQSSSRLLETMKGTLPSIYDKGSDAETMFRNMRQAVANKAEVLNYIHGVQVPFNPYAYQGIKPSGFALMGTAAGSAGAGSFGTQAYNPDDWEDVTGGEQ
jgi:hypothetical protein